MSSRKTSENRSKVMRAVKSKGNRTTELKLIEIFRARGIKGWRRNYRLLGKPDFVFPRYKVVVFTDGCFWHGHDCRNTKPVTNVDYWQPKLERNAERDREITNELTRRGWLVIRIWECEIKKGQLDKLLILEQGMNASGR